VLASFGIHPPRPAADCNSAAETRARREILKGVPTILDGGAYRMYFHSHERTSLPMSMWIATISRKVLLDRLRWQETLGSSGGASASPPLVRNGNLLLEKWHDARNLNSGERVRDVHVTEDTLRWTSRGRTIIVPDVVSPAFERYHGKRSRWKVSGAVNGFTGRTSMKT